jgi:arylsulfate sulfotransferase
VLGETCTPTSVRRPLTAPFTRANDWLHTNCVQYTPWDGNLIASFRSQDWVIKINYADGAGDGTVLWRMGAGGDFTITTNGTASSADVGFPWFSHQHDAEFELRGTLFGARRVMTVYDNGNTRRTRFNPAANSRCQSYAVDETNLTVNLNINADVGVYSVALGSAQLLTNGDLSCNSGAVVGPSRTSENDRAGVLVYVIEWAPSTYRTFRMINLYTPVNP